MYAPENTVASFISARGKADLMELDAQITSDGQFVVMHDSTVDRTTDGTGAIATNTLAKLKLLDAGSWFAPQFTGERIPTLEEAVQAIIPYGTPLIEQKAGSAASYVAELQRLGVVTNVVLQSFDWAFLTAVHALEPNLRLCALGSGTLSADLPHQHHQRRRAHHCLGAVRHHEQRSRAGAWRRLVAVCLDGGWAGDSAFH